MLIISFYARSGGDGVSQPAIFVAASTLYFRDRPDWTALSNDRRRLKPGQQIAYQSMISHSDYDYIQTKQGFLPIFNHQMNQRYGVWPGMPIASEDDVASVIELRGQFKLTKRAVNVYWQPDLSSHVVTRLRQGTVVNYVGKCASKHRGWLVIRWQQRDYYVPFMTRYPHHEHYYGIEITGSKPVKRLQEPWTVRQMQALPDIPVENTDFKPLLAKINQVKQTDAVVFGLITDTHYDAVQSQATVQTLSDLRQIQQFAKLGHLDAVIMNGDLVDGTQPISRTVLDTGDAVAAISDGPVPVLFSLGNHDDNSGFARYLNGFRTDQVITNQTIYALRASAYHRLNTDQQLYGRFRLPGSQVSVIVLNSFDIPDYVTDGNFKRHYEDQPNGIHWTGILQNIRHSRSRFGQAQADWFVHEMSNLDAQEQVLVVSHDTIRSAQTHEAVSHFWTYDWFANNQQGAYVKIYDALTQHHDQIIAVLSGHTHVDDWSDEDGINWITTTSDIVDRRKTAQGRRAHQNAWDVLVINPTARELHRFRHGWADREGQLLNWQYRLFGDGTEQLRRSPLSRLKQFKARPLKGNARYYQNQNQQVTQKWRGFKGYFRY